MASDVIGSLRGFTANGQDFRPAADSNVTIVPSKYENSRVANSGKSMRKMVARIPSADGIVLTVNLDEYNDLKAMADSLDNAKLSIALASKGTFKCEGSMELSGYESEEGRISVRAEPVDEWDTEVV